MKLSFKVAHIYGFEPHVSCSEARGAAFLAHEMILWNSLQKMVKLNELIPFNQKESLLDDKGQCECVF